MSAFQNFLTARSQKIEERKGEAQEKRDIETHKSNLKYQGILGEKLTDDMMREKRKAEKAAQIGTLTGTYLQAPNQGARATALQGLTALDPAAAAQAQTIYGSQQERLQGEQDQAKAAYTQQFQVARGLPDAQRGEAYQSMIASAVQQGIATEEEADQLSMIAQADPAQFEGVMEQILGIEPEARLPAGGVQQLVNPETGESAGVDMTTPEGRDRALQLLENGWIEAPSKQETGGAGEFAGGDKVLIRKFKEMEVGTLNALDTIDDAISRLEANPDAFTKIGQFANFANGLKNEAQAALRQVGLEPSDAVTDISQYASEFEKLGIDNQRVQGVVFDMALTYAGAIGLGQGRALTDRDIRLALNRVGGKGITTGAARKGMMEDVRAILIRNFKNSYSVMHPEGEYTGDLGGRIEREDADIGMIEDGYRYIGGDKASPDSWELVE